VVDSGQCRTRAERGDWQANRFSICKMMEIEVRLFNSLRKYGPRKLEIAEGSRVGDVLAQLKIPAHEIHVVLLNGRNIMDDDGIETERRLEPGDVLALSGPVPWSKGYGSAVV
jgi:ThiS family.